MIEWIILIIISMLPWIELRGAIPVGILVYGLDPMLVFIVCTITNILVMIPVYTGLIFFYDYFKKYAWIKNTVERVRDRSGPRIHRYGPAGLMMFVAIPFPVTGAWAGTLLAWILDMKKPKAFAAIAIGVTIAGVLVTLISLGAAGVITWFS